MSSEREPGGDPLATQRLALNFGDYCIKKPLEKVRERIQNTKVKKIKKISIAIILVAPFVVNRSSSA